jgi:hypothetical protein
MKVRSIAITTGIVLAFVSNAVAQSYSTTAGLRFASSKDTRQFGFTVQQRLAKHITAEGILQTDFRDNHTVHLLAEKHHSIVSKRWNYYYGAGISLGNEESFLKDPDTHQKVTTYDNKTVGIDAIAGVEFTMLRLNVSWDIKPNFNITGRENFITLQTGISVRSVLVSNSDKRKKERKKKWDELFGRDN